MPLHRRQDCAPGQSAGSSVSPTSNQARSLRVLSMGRRECPSGGALKEELFSALLVGDNELGHILQQVDEISRTLKSDGPESQKVSNVLRLTEIGRASCRERV